MQPPQRLDVLLGYKALAHYPGLTTSQRRVGCFILDCYNYQTGQCDPSVKTISRRLQISERTVFRALAQLAPLELFIIKSHGSDFYRNFYHPNWVKYRQIEQEWASRKSAASKRRRSQKMSSSRCQFRQQQDDNFVTSTSISNPSKKTSSYYGRANKISQGAFRSSKSDKQNSFQSIPTSFHVKQRDSARSRNDAQRRWDNNVMKLVGQSQHLYSHIIDAVDGSAITIATDLEMKEPGSGCAYILNLAREKGVLIPMGSSGTELDSS